MIWGDMPEIFLKRLLAILDRLKKRGTFVAAQKAVFFRTEVKRCGKLLSEQTGSHDPKRTQGLSEFLQHLVTAELHNVHVARMRFYADDHLEITGELLKVLQQLENQGEYYTRSISAIKLAASGDDVVVKVACEGLEEAESTWEPVSRVLHDPPAVLHKELKSLQLKAEQKRCSCIGVGCVCDHIVIGEGIQDSELLMFWFFHFFCPGVSALSADSA